MAEADEKSTSESTTLGVYRRVAKNNVAATPRRGSKNAGYSAPYEILLVGNAEDVDRGLHALAIPLAERGDLDALEQLLFRGWIRPPEIQLNQAECHFLWKMVRRERKRQPRRGHPKNLEAQKRAKHIAIYSNLLELDGMSIEAAVAAAMELYKVSRPTVFAARKRWYPRFRDSIERAPLEQRQQQRQWCEEMAHLFRV